MATTKAFELGDLGTELVVNADGTISSLDITTNEVTEHVNHRYFTEARVRASLSVTGNITYDSETGEFGFTMPTTIASLSNHDTDALDEGAGNLYFTSARARASLSGGTGLTYSSSTGQFLITDTAVTAGSYGSASQVPVITVNAQGQITSASTTAVAGVSSTAYNTSTGVLTINTSDGGSFTEDFGVGTADSPAFTGLYFLDGAERTITGGLNQNLVINTRGNALAEGLEIKHNGTTTALFDNAGDVQFSGSISVTGTVDGRDVAADGTKLDGIESGATADQTKADIDALGIDAETLDGLNSTQFLRSDADDLSSGRLAIKTGTQYSVGGNHELSLLNSMAIGPSNTDLVYFRYQGAAGEYAIQTYDSGNSGELHLQPYGGNVGIGTSTPSTILHTSGNVVRFERNGHSIYANPNWAGGGIFSALQSSLDIALVPSSGASNVLYVKGSNNSVGIGTASPDAKLDIEGNFESNYALKFTNTMGTGVVSGFRSHGTNGESLSLYHDGFRRQYWNSTGSVVFENNSGTNQLTIAANGNVGINTASPSAPLHINSDSEHQIKVTATAAAGASMQLYTGGGYAYHVFSNSNKTWRMGAYGGSNFTLLNHSDNVTALSVTSGGNVGIGTASPANTLTVNGGTESVGVEISETQRLTIGADGTWNYFKGKSGNGHYFNTTGGGILVLKNDGNVGIGTASPGEKLAVSGNVIANRYKSNIATTGDGQTNMPFQIVQDYNSWMVTTANDPATWGLFWAGNTGARYGTNGNGGPGNIWSNSGNPNEFVFVGSDGTKWTCYGNTGDTWQGGSARATSFIGDGSQLTGLFNKIANSYGTNASDGYVRFSDGLMLQWCRKTIGGDRNQNFSWPTAFPNYCMFATTSFHSDYNNSDSFAGVYSPNATTFTLANGNNVTRSMNVFGIGR